MKNAVIALVMMVSAQAFGSVTLDLGAHKMDRQVSEYLAKRLEACSQGVAQEVFSVMNVVVKKDVVDNGIVDYYYTVDVGYAVNGEAMGAVEVKMVDWALSNYDTIEQKISFEVSQDHTGLCK